MKTITDFLSETGFEDVDSLIAGLKVYFGSNSYDWNSKQQIIGFRTNDDYDDAYSDCFLILKDDAITCISGCTKRGKYWLDLKKGCTQKEGQIKGMWAVGNTPWSGDPYLQQVRECTVYRDESGLDHIDRDSPQETGLFGINFHSWKGIGENPKVNNVSEGCQVMNEEEDKEAFAVIDTFEDKQNIDYTLIFTPNFISA